jgi:hypothetical protein
MDTLVSNLTHEVIHKAIAEALTHSVCTECGSFFGVTHTRIDGNFKVVCDDCVLDGVMCICGYNDLCGWCSYAEELIEVFEDDEPLEVDACTRCNNVLEGYNDGLVFRCLDCWPKSHGHFDCCDQCNARAAGCDEIDPQCPKCRERIIVLLEERFCSK